MPSEISDDYSDPPLARHTSRTSTSSLPFPFASTASDIPPVPPLPRRPSATSPSKPKRKPTDHAPLSESETTVLIELFFASINELYTLSSAWGLRRTLLNAAKTFLLRPGNPQLASIQTLLQTSVLDENTSDSGLAAILKKVRANALPTEEETEKWNRECTRKGWINGVIGEAEKEEMRVKARRALVERGMPQALTSVMGQAASGEALGRVFDALQVEEVARGVVFGLVLQALRGVVQ